MVELPPDIMLELLAGFLALWVLPILLDDILPEDIEPDDIEPDDMEPEPMLF